MQFNKKLIYYVSILIGLLVAIYAQAGADQNVYVLVIGIVLLMFGLYNISTGLSSRKEPEGYVKTEIKKEDEI